MYPSINKKKFLIFQLTFMLMFFVNIIEAKSIKHKIQFVEMNMKQQKPIKLQDFNKISWLEKLKIFNRSLKDCNQSKNQTTWLCFQKIILLQIQNLFAADVITLWHGVRLVPADLNKTINVQHLNETKSFDSFENQDNKYLTLFDRLALSLSKTLTTHNLQINLKELTDAYMRNSVGNLNSSQINDSVGTMRLHRHRYNMAITMMFGVTALGAVLVPIGFQILSIVSGKALLLAKMALLLASINGLKRVANSGLHYGLYHVPGEHYSGLYDRGDNTNSRKVPNLLITQPSPFDIGV